MRLGQLARHNDISVQELIEYLEKEDAAGENPLTPNTRLTDYQLDLIYEHFVVEKNEPENELVEESDQKDENAEIAIDSTPDHNVDLIEESVLSTAIDESSKNEETEPSGAPSELIEEDGEEDGSKEAEIRTDEFLELLEKGDDSVDISAFTKIKAPKKKLEGIKVVGKIELPDPPKPKSKKDDNNTTSENDALRNHKKRHKNSKRPILSEEEKEKRRLRAKNKREAAKKREEEKRQQAEKERLKELRRLHYEKNLQKKAEARERKNSQKSTEETNKQKDNQTKPKTLIGRFWRWFTSY